MTVTSNSVSGATIGATGTSTTTYSGGNIRGAVGNDAATTFYSRATPHSIRSYRYPRRRLPRPASPSPISPLTSARLKSATASFRQFRYQHRRNFTGIQMIGTVPTPSANATTKQPALYWRPGAGPDRYTGVVCDYRQYVRHPAESDGGVTGFAAVPYNIIYVADPKPGQFRPGHSEVGLRHRHQRHQRRLSLQHDHGYNRGWVSIGMYAVAGQEDGSGDVILYGTSDAVAATGLPPPQ